MALPQVKEELEDSPSMERLVCLYPGSVSSQKENKRSASPECRLEYNPNELTYRSPTNRPKKKRKAATLSDRWSILEKKKVALNEKSKKEPRKNEYFLIEKSNRSPKRVATKAPRPKRTLMNLLKNIRTVPRFRKRPREPERELPRVTSRRYARPVDIGVSWKAPAIVEPPEEEAEGEGEEAKKRRKTGTVLSRSVNAKGRPAKFSRRARVYERTQRRAGNDEEDDEADPICLPSDDFEAYAGPPSRDLKEECCFTSPKRKRRRRDEFKPQPCYFFNHGGCMFGENCYNLHDTVWDSSWPTDNSLDTYSYDEEEW